jgi:V8-like Glu-specific endopeptidase
MKYSVCKIYKRGENGTGFFCNLPYKSKSIPFLITNNHILNSEDIEINKDIKISLNNGREFKNINIDESRIVLTNEYLDFTLIEIIPNKDKIDITKFLDFDENVNINEKFLKEFYEKNSVYIIHYPKEENIFVSYGLLSEIKETEIYHLCSTEKGSSGGPILSLQNYKVIGIHYGTETNLNVNLGTFMKYIIMELDNYNKNYKINENIINENINKIQNIKIANENNLYQNKFNENNNLFQKIKSNNIIIIENDNMDYKNNVNKEKIQIEILSKTDRSLSIKAFPNEYNFMNILFKNDTGFITNIIIPQNKHISELLNIFAKINEFEINKLFFIFNGSKMNKYDQRPIFQVLNNGQLITVITH